MFIPISFVGNKFHNKFAVESECPAKVRIVVGERYLPRLQSKSSIFQQICKCGRFLIWESRRHSATSQFDLERVVKRGIG